MKKYQHIIGGVNIRTSYSIIELGQIISKEILNGLELSGLEKRIYDEIPAVFCGCFGLSLVLQGYSSVTETDNNVFNFDILPNYSYESEVIESVDLSSYLNNLFRDKLAEYKSIEIIS